MNTLLAHLSDSQPTDTTTSIPQTRRFYSVLCLKFHAMVWALLAFVPTLLFAQANTVFNAYIPNEYSYSVSVINTATKQISTTISLGGTNAPYGVAVAPNNALVLVTNPNFETGTPTVSVISAVSNTVLATINVSDLGGGGDPEGIVITPDSSTAYIAMEGECGSTCAIMKMSTTSPYSHSVIAGVAGNPIGIAITPDGSRVYVAVSEPGNSYDQVAYFPTGQSNPTVSYVTIDKGANGIAITPDGTTVYVTEFTSNSIAYFSTSGSNPTVHQIALPAGAQPEGIAITSDGSKVYVANSGTNNVSVISTSTHEQLVSPISVGSYPQGLSVTPDNFRVYVTNSNSNSVSIIDAVNETVVGSGIDVGSTPNGFGNFIQQQAVSKVVGDFNGDGKADYALVGNNLIYTFFSKGDGTYTAHTFSVPNGWAFGQTPSAAYVTVVGDLNGDGKKDFALVGSTAVYSFFSNGDGTYSGDEWNFPSGYVFGSPPSSQYVAIGGDLNNDGKADFALVGATAVYSFFSYGDGTYAPVAWTIPNGWNFGTPPTQSYTPVAEDLNNDGKADFALVGSAQVYSFFSYGNGTYAAVVWNIPNGWTFGSPPNVSYAPVVGDLNDDGKGDFALVGSTQVYSFFSYGDGTYAPVEWNIPNGWAFGSPPNTSYTPFVMDLNGDGKTDCVLASATQAYTFFSYGDGTYAAPSPYTYPNGWALGTPPAKYFTPAVGDFNGDGYGDFVFFNGTVVYSFFSYANGTFAGVEQQ